MSPLKIWLLASRPKTLPAAIAPVLMGTAMAVGDGIHHWKAAFAALVGALAIQIGTNLANDYFDFKKGADTPDRTGPLRVTQAGLIKPKAMLAGMILVFSVAAICCIWLVMRAGWPIAVIGILAVTAGVLYTAGPYPLGYLGLGEIFVLIFFGPVAVAGTYYVQSLELNLAVILAGIAVGLLSSAVLVVNNLRDRATDLVAGKRTLAVRFGTTFSRCEYFLLIILASLTPVLIYVITHDHLKTMWAVLTAPAALPAILLVFTRTDGPSLNRALALTGGLTLIYSILFAIGWIL